LISDPDHSENEENIIRLIYARKATKPESKYTFVNYMFELFGFTKEMLQVLLLNYTVEVRNR